MCALICREFGEAGWMRVETIADPEIQSGEILVEVHAAGLNYSDKLVVEGRHQTRPSLPFVPGAECAGIVLRVGQDVTDFHAGDHVCCMPFSLGAFTERVAVPATACFRIPESMPFVDAAVLPNSYFSAYHALIGRGALAAGETLLIMGSSGGAGIAAIQIAKAVGAKVIAAVSSKDRVASVRELGADLVFDSSNGEFRSGLRALLDGKSLDVVFDTVGGPFSEVAMRELGWRGRLLVVGFAGGAIPAVRTNLVLLKERTVLGILYGAWAWAWRNPEENQSYFAPSLTMYQNQQLRPLLAGRYALVLFFS